MKLFALATVASASTTEWMMNTWWEEATGVFNFASGNFDQFKAAVDQVPDAKWDPLWNFCNASGDGELTSEELVACGQKAAAYAEMPDEYQNHMYDFAKKYFSTIDLDGSGTLNKEEYKNTMAGFAATDARVIMRGFDADSNGLLDETELGAWRTFLKGVMTEWNWEPSEAMVAGLKQAWADAQVNGDAKSASMIEIAHFMINFWNVLLTN